MMFKRGLLLFSILSALPLVQADLGDTVSNVWLRILSIGSLNFLGISDHNMLLAFLRILIFILIFALLYALFHLLESSFGFLTPRTTLVLSAIISIISVIFLPAEVLLAVGGTWGTIVSLILIGGPVFGLGVLLHYISNNHFANLVLKFFICLLLFWIITVVKAHAGGLPI